MGFSLQKEIISESILQKASLLAKNVSSSMGVEITDEMIYNTAAYCKRKLEVIKKPESYFDVLFECELKNFVQMRVINNLSINLI